VSETMAIIRNPGCGGRDVGRPVLFFDVAGEGWGALQVFEVESDEARELLSSVYSVEKLNGKAVIVEREGNRVSFKRLAKIL
jgi:hypothetical protein